MATLRLPILRRTAIACCASLTLLPALAAARPLNREHARLHAALQCQNADSPAVSVSAKAMRAAVDCLINQQRIQRGLPPLRSSRRLNRSAQSWTDSMVASGQFTHGADFSARITAVGFTWQDVGENIATGFDTPRAVVKAWMASLDHCTNILDPNYSAVGTGVNVNAVGSFTGATWTQDFALPAQAHVPSHDWAPYRGCPYVL